MAETKKAPAKKTAKKTTTKKAANALSVVAYDVKGKEGKSISLPKEMFGLEVSPKLLAQYVRVYLGNQRQGTQVVKSRSEVVGSTRKIYRQKGTGRARHGARSAPIFVGGGSAHGPKLRSHNLKLNKKQRQKALFGGLSATLKNKHMFVLTGADKVNKTKELEGALKGMGPEIKGKTLIAYASENERGLYQAANNLENVTATDAKVLNAYDVLRAGRLVWTENGLNSFLELRK